MSRDSSTTSLKDRHNRSVMDEEIIRLARDRKMILLEVESPDEDKSGKVLDEVFKRVVQELEIGERGGLYRDPAYLLGKNVDLGAYLLNDEEFLGSALFTSPG
jgi:hypothetical protein